MIFNVLIVGKAREVAESIFHDECKKIQAKMNLLAMDIKLERLSKYQKHIERIIGDIPAFLFETGFAEQLLTSSHGKINEQFIDWYEFYKRLIRNHKKFPPLIVKHVDKYSDDLFLDAEYGFDGRIIVEDDHPFDYVLPAVGEKIIITVLAFKEYNILLRDYLNQCMKQLISPVSGPGLDSLLTEEQLSRLFQECIDEKLISIDTTKENFIAAFRNNELPPFFRPIKWIKITKFGKPNRTILWALIDTGVAKKHKNHAIISKVFIGEDGSNIIPGTRPDDEYYDTWKKTFSELINQ